MITSDTSSGRLSVLITGGTGVLGTALTDRLAGRADVRVLSRVESPEPSVVTGDLETGAGLAEALDGVDVVAHCASAADYRRPIRDVEQTKRLLHAVERAGGRPHIVYISIVGVDSIPFGYYRAKLASERLVEASGLPWTILRATQFHDLVLMFAQLAVAGPVAVAFRDVRAQPVDVGEVADRLTGLVLAEPAGRVADMGGPLVEDSANLLRTYLKLTDRRKPLVQLPLPGKVGAGFRAGHHLVVGDGVRGQRTFAEYLSELQSSGDVESPYDLKERRRRGRLSASQVMPGGNDPGRGIRSRKYRLMTTIDAGGNLMTRYLLRTGIAPRAFALLETTGRVSGHPRQTPVGDGLVGGTFWLIALHGEQADYVRNILADLHVRVKIGKTWRNGRATVLPDDDADARSRTLPHQWDKAIGRAMASHPLTIRIDLDPDDSAAR